jgi:cell wall-associated NlpC family hydrolase
MLLAIATGGGTAALALAVVAVAALVVTGLTGAAPPSGHATATIPASMLTLYQQAGTSECPSMPWEILAAIGTVESSNGASSLPGVHSGANFAGAEGPMQFLPATFAAFDQPVPPGGALPPDIYDPIDAVHAAARMLCADGGRTGAYRQAIFAYNHSDAYVEQVWELAESYGMTVDAAVGAGLPSSATPAPGPGRTWVGDPSGAVRFALGQVGVPYVWGGAQAGVGLDCSGLVLVAYRSIGITLPRTTFAQATFGLPVAVDSLAPGDLLFFRGGEPITDLGHVGMYVGQGLMVDAPHTGADVSVVGFDLSSVEVARRIVVPAGGQR